MIYYKQKRHPHSQSLESIFFFCSFHSIFLLFILVSLLFVHAPHPVRGFAVLQLGELVARLLGHCGELHLRALRRAVLVQEEHEAEDGAHANVGVRQLRAAQEAAAVGQALLNRRKGILYNLERGNGRARRAQAKRNNQNLPLKK